MLATAIIVFREAMEAGLIVGIVLAAARGVPGRGAMVALGVAAGVLGSALIATFAGAIGSAFDGSGQELLNAAVLAVAVAMLTWHVVWMRRHGRQMATELRQVGASVEAGRQPVSALAIVVAVAVLREGFEVVLFLSGIAIGADTSWLGMAAGAALGVAAAAGLSALTYAGLVQIPPGRLFQVTGGLITLLAAGLAAQAAGFLQQAGYAETLTATVWDTSWLLSDASLAGRALRAMIGYTARPSGLQALVYGLTVAVIAGLSARMEPRRARRVETGL